MPDRWCLSCTGYNRKSWGEGVAGDSAEPLHGDCTLPAPDFQGLLETQRGLGSPLTFRALSTGKCRLSQHIQLMGWGWNKGQKGIFFTFKVSKNYTWKILQRN